MCDVLLPPGVNPTAVKYIYHIISNSGAKRLKSIFRKWDVGVWTRFGWLRIETGGGHL
jgi:hypothetical protein